MPYLCSVIELQKPLEFPECLCLANNVTHDEPLDSFRMGAGSPEKGWDFQSPDFQGEV